jgi:hypothetical protein
MQQVPVTTNELLLIDFVVLDSLLHQILQTPSHQYHSLEKLLLLLNGAF